MTRTIKTPPAGKPALQSFQTPSRTLILRDGVPREISYDYMAMAQHEMLVGPQALEVQVDDNGEPLIGEDGQILQELVPVSGERPGNYMHAAYWAYACSRSWAKRNGEKMDFDAFCGLIPTSADPKALQEFMTTILGLLTEAHGIKPEGESGNVEVPAEAASATEA